mgnify:CR=1 FL=1
MFLYIFIHLYDANLIDDVKTNKKFVPMKHGFMITVYENNLNIYINGLLHGKILNFQR